MNAVASNASPARKFAGYIALTVAIVAADQATKQLALKFLPGGGVDILSWLSFVLVFNRGAAFGFLADAGGWQTVFLSALAAALSLVLLAWLWRATRAPHQNGALLCCGLALLLGGALGNLIDRALYQFVIDFIVLHHRGWQFPAFNLADSAISIGAACIILDHFIGGGARQNRRV